MIRHDHFLGFYMLRHGFQPLWEAMLTKERLQIHYGVDIQHVYRRHHGSWLCTKRHRECKFYNFIIWSPELKQSLHKFRPLFEDERDIFSRTKPIFFTTSLINSLGVRRGLTPIDFMLDNALKKREHRIWVQRDSFASVKGYKGHAYQNGSLPSGKEVVLR